MLILDFNDSELRIAEGDKILARAPGYAVLDGDDFVLGSEAAAKSRLNPRASYHSFWEQLDQQPLNRAAGRAQSHADIAYFHLSALWQAASAQASSRADKLIIAVPAQYGTDRLALLLGIAKACGMPVLGIVDSAVLAASAQPGLSCQYLDISQHRVYHSRVDERGSLLGAEELSQQGLLWCYEQCIKSIASQFMAETRFDPLHEAASEQRLFDELPQWLRGFDSAERLSLSLPAGQRRHSIEVPRAGIIEQLQPLYRSIEDAVNEAGGSLLLSHRLAALPGLAARLNAPLLDETHFFATASHRAAEIISDPESPVWIKHLPVNAALADAEVHTPALTVAAKAASAQATHILHRHIAYPLSSRPLKLGAVPEEADGAVCVVQTKSRVLLKGDGEVNLLVNGENWRGEERDLQLGDQLQCGSEFYQLVFVRDGS